METPLAGVQEEPWAVGARFWEGETCPGAVDIWAEAWSAVLQAMQSGEGARWGKGPQVAGRVGEDSPARRGRLRRE